MALDLIEEFARRFNRVLIVGGSGFIGSRVTELLADNGIQVFSASRMPPRASAQREVPSNDSVEYVKFKDHTEVAGLIEAIAPQIVINLATFFTKLDDHESTDKLIEANVSLVAHLALACAVHRVPIVQAQSAWQFNAQGDLDPLTPYYLYKQIGQEICEWYGRHRGLRVNFVRFFDTYGPQDTRAKVVNLLVSSFENDVALDLSGGNQLVNLLHVDDAAMGVIATSLGFNQGDIMETYWCSGQNDLTLKDLVVILSTLFGRTPCINWGVIPYRPGEIFEPWTFEMKIPPNWKPQIELKSGLERVVHTNRAVTLNANLPKSRARN